MTEPIGGVMMERRGRDAVAAAAMAGSGLVGEREWVGLPDFGIGCIQAWLEPGADASMLEASDVTVVDEGGERWARLTLRPIPEDDRTAVEAEAPLVSEAAAGLDGEAVIHTLLTLGSQTWAVELRLVTHRLRRARIHLGRDALGQRFAVQPGKSFLAGPPNRS